MVITELSEGVYKLDLSPVEHQVVRKLAVVYGAEDLEIVRTMHKFAEHMAVSHVLIPIGEGL